MNLKRFFFSSSKKGQISIQFNWIFVLIVGVIILGFFFTAISNTSNTAQTKVTVSVAKSFQTIFSSTAQKSATVKSFTIPQGTLSFMCSDTAGFYDYRFNDYVVDQTKYDLFFGPLNLEGRQLFTYTEKFDLGFDVGTFLFVTNEDTAYVFQQTASGSPSKDAFPNDISSTGLMTSYRDFLESFPKKFTKIIIQNEDDVANLAEQKYTHYVVFAFEDQNVNHILDKIPSEETTFVHIRPEISSDVFAKGLVGVYSGDEVPDNLPTLAFSEYLSSDYFSFLSKPTLDAYSAPYVGKASLMAAVFTQDISQYVCGMNKALKKTYMVSSLLYNKTVNQSAYLSYVCQDILGLGHLLMGPIDYLQSIRDASSSQNGWGINSANILYKQSKKLDKRNTELYIAGTCLPIY